MHYDTTTTTNGRNIASLLAEIKDEIRDFLQTRIAILKTELKEKSQNLKTAAILAVSGLLLLTTAYMLLTLALVGLVVAAFPTSAYRWFFAFLAVGILWSILGGIAAYFAKRELELKGLLPKRTIEVLKGDKVWVQTEVKSQI
ncbi:MAG TPA: phage holin family protein [Candidatus Sulfotelmatobacter sp.]|nr:phage holin family protein [Candidatus Sulfotelmatobacter sp.]